MPRPSRSTARYPTLLAVAALALGAAACGPEGQALHELTQALTPSTQPADAGQPPQPGDFIGGAAPVEVLRPDGGRP